MTHSPQPALTVVVPLYNEAEALPAFLLRLLPLCQQQGWQVIFVNDGSRDQTRAILEQYAHLPFVRIFHHKVNRGYGGALKTGLLAATTPYVVTIDGDGQHDPEDILHLFHFTLQHDADLVIGRRDPAPQGDLYRRLGKTLIRAFTRLLMPLPIHDLNSGFKLYRTELAQIYLTVCPDHGLQRRDHPHLPQPKRPGPRTSYPRLSPSPRQEHHQHLHRL